MEPYMMQSKRVYILENQTFVVSKNVDGFPVQCISFLSPQSNEEINGVLQGEGISSGEFTGRFIAANQVELFFRWLDRSSSHCVTGKIVGILCGDTSGEVQFFLNWYCLHGRQGYGAASYTQLQ